MVVAASAAVKASPGIERGLLVVVVDAVLLEVGVLEQGEGTSRR